MISPADTRKPTLNAPGLITADERDMLITLGERMATNQGVYIDAGSFLGASAEALGRGFLKANVERTSPQIHCFDTFTARFPETCDLIAKKAGTTLSVGDSFLPLFQDNTAAVQQLIEIHNGDLCDAQQFDHPISLLFIDICKSLELHSQVYALFFPQLIPGESILIQQDYFHPHLPFIHVCLEFLLPHLRIVHPRIGESLILKFQSRPPSTDLNKVITYDFTAEEQLRLMDNAIARQKDTDTFELCLARLTLIRHLFGPKRFEKEVTSFVSCLSRTLTKRQKIYLDRIEVYAITGTSKFAGW